MQIGKGEKPYASTATFFLPSLRNATDSDTVLPMTPARLTFFSRLTSTLVLWALMLTTVFAGWDIGFFSLLSFMALRALWEYYRMLEHDGISVLTLTGLICAAALLLGGFLIVRSEGPQNGNDFELLVLVL
jgi:CDP-diglyceride synthetase